MKETIDLFHHPFMKGELQIHDDGTSYPKVTLAPAGVVIPFKRHENACHVYLMEQSRPEDGGKTYLKSIGAYLRGRNPIDAMKEALLHKVGIQATGDLQLIGKSIGYSVARTEIYCYSIQSFEFEQPDTPHSCLQCLTIDEAIEKALQGEMLDDCTTIPLLALYRQLHL